MKRFTFAGLLAVGMLIYATSIASAIDPSTTFHVPLYPPTGGVFPNASGSVSLKPWKLPIGYYLTGVSLSQLAPNTKYYMPVHWMRFNSFSRRWVEVDFNVTFKTDANGNYVRNGPGMTISVYDPFDVYDSSTGTLVLTSETPD